MVTIDNGNDSLMIGKNLLDALDNAGVFSVEQLSDGRFCFIESCDRYFSANLTNEQVLALADELRALAGGYRLTPTSLACAKPATSEPSVT